MQKRDFCNHFFCVFCRDKWWKHAGGERAIHSFTMDGARASSLDLQIHHCKCAHSFLSPQSHQKSFWLCWFLCSEIQCLYVLFYALNLSLDGCLNFEVVVCDRSLNKRYLISWIWPTFYLHCVYVYVWIVVWDSGMGWFPVGILQHRSGAGAVPSHGREEMAVLERCSCGPEILWETYE